MIANYEKLLIPWLKGHGFTDDSCQIVNGAIHRATSRGLAGTVSPLILLWSLVRWEKKLGRSALEVLIPDFHSFEIAIDRAIEASECADADLRMDFCNCQAVVDLAIDEAHLVGTNYVGSEHLVQALLRLSGAPRDLLANFGITLDGYKFGVRRILEQRENR